MVPEPKEMCLYVMKPRADAKFDASFLVMIK